MAAEYITLAKGAKLTVRKGGKALNVVNVGGEINAEEDAIVTFMMPKEETSVKVIGMTLETSPLYLEKNHKGINLTIAKDQKLILCSGSTAENTTVEKGGEIIIRDDAEGNGITLNGGKLTVRTGGKAHHVLNNGGVIDAAEDAVITFATASAKMSAKNTEKPASAEKKPVRKAEAKKASAEKKPVRKAEAKKASVEKKPVRKAEAKKVSKS